MRILELTIQNVRGLPDLQLKLNSKNVLPADDAGLPVTEVAGAGG